MLLYNSIYYEIMVGFLFIFSFAGKKLALAHTHANKLVLLAVEISEKNTLCSAQIVYYSTISLSLTG